MNDVGEDIWSSRDKDELEEWLRERPREDAVVLAARAALRALATVASHQPPAGETKHAESFAQLVATLLRPAALARVAGKYPSRADELRAGADAAFTATAVAFDPDCMFAGDAANAAAGAVVADDEDDAANAAADAAFAVDAAFGFAADEADQAKAADAAAAVTAADVEFLTNGGTAAQLADQPLWLGGAPPDWAADLWRRLRLALPAGQDWDVWTPWFDERLLGAVSPSEAYEFAFASVPNEVWSQGPAAANRWIKEHLPK